MLYLKKLISNLLARAGISSFAGEPLFDLGAYDPVRTSPGADETGSFPMGIGNVGINLWAEETNGLMFYLSRNAAWAEQMALCNLGRVRVALSPDPFRKGFPFRQELKLVDGRCEIEAGLGRRRGPSPTICARLGTPWLKVNIAAAIGNFYKSPRNRGAKLWFCRLAPDALCNDSF